MIFTSFVIFTSPGKFLCSWQSCTQKDLQTTSKYNRNISVFDLGKWHIYEAPSQTAAYLSAPEKKRQITFLYLYNQQLDWSTWKEMLFSMLKDYKDFTVFNPWQGNKLLSFFYVLSHPLGID